MSLDVCATCSQDYRHNFHEARDQNLTYQKEIEALHSQMKTSSEKYDLSQVSVGVVMAMTSVRLVLSWR